VDTARDKRNAGSVREPSQALCRIIIETLQVTELELGRFQQSAILAFECKKGWTTQFTGERIPVGLRCRLLRYFCCELPAKC
jgi:hypothetical protein